MIFNVRSTDSRRPCQNLWELRGFDPRPVGADEGVARQRQTCHPREGREPVQPAKADVPPRWHFLPILPVACRAQRSCLANEWPTNDQWHDRRTWRSCHLPGTSLSGWPDLTGGLFVPKPSSQTSVVRILASNLGLSVRRRPLVYVSVCGDRHSVSHSARSSVLGDPPARGSSIGVCPDCCLPVFWFADSDETSSRCCQWNPQGRGRSRGRGSAHYRIIGANRGWSGDLGWHDARPRNSTGRARKRQHFHYRGVVAGRVSGDALQRVDVITTGFGETPAMSNAVGQPWPVKTFCTLSRRFCTEPGAPRTWATTGTKRSRLFIANRRRMVVSTGQVGIWTIA